MLKYLLINLLFLTICLGNDNITPSPPPASEKWIFYPPKDRTIRTFAFVDQCGGVGQTMLSPNQETLFTVSSSVSNKSNYLNNTNLVLHALYSNNGTERWNKYISHKYVNGQLFVSPTDKYVIYGYSTGNNTFNINTLHINNGSLLWNKTIYGNPQYNVDSLSLFRTVSNENRIILSPTTDWKGRALKVYDIPTAKTIYMETDGSNPTGPINFINTKGIVYTTGYVGEFSINSNWLSNGSKRVLGIPWGGRGSSVRGADSSFIVLDSPIDNGCCYTLTNIYSLKSGKSLGSGCGNACQESSSIEWIKFVGNGYILYQSYQNNVHIISCINDNTTIGKIWEITLFEKEDISINVLYNNNLVIFTSTYPSQYNSSSTSSRLIAINLNNGTIKWENEFVWTALKSGYESAYNIDSCYPPTYSLNNYNSTIILLDNEYNGHAVSLINGTELFNISIKIAPNPYPPQYNLSVVSHDAKTIYSSVPQNSINNGYIKASYVGNNCDSNHYGQGCNKSCDCIFEHGIKKCDSGVFGSGQCSGPCNKHWVGYRCDECDTNYYGQNCSGMKCNTGISPIGIKIGGICDCGITGSGHCRTCYPGYTGLDCDDCSKDFYGRYCAKSCPCKHGLNSSGINGTGHCKYCDDKKWSGIDCDLCHGKNDAPQCGTKYKVLDCFDPINGASIRQGCPSMCNSCPSSIPNPYQKYKCFNNECLMVSNSTYGGGTLDECHTICGKGYWNSINGYCLPSTSVGLNRTQCKKMCYNGITQINNYI